MSNVIQVGEVYKVVRPDEFGEFWSSTIYVPPYRTKFVIGERSIPPVGALFAFNHEEDAQGFCNGKQRILRCRAEWWKPQVRKILDVFPYMNAETLDRVVTQFWAEDPAFDGALQDLRPGTVWCSWIEPLEVMP